MTRKASFRKKSTPSLILSSQRLNRFNSSYPFAAKLREVGYLANKKLVQRVRREEGLQVPPRRARQRRRGLSTGLPQAAARPNHVWAWDFVSDYTERGGALRTFNLIDEYTRHCHCIHADRAIRAADVITVLKEAIERHGAPEYIRSDNVLPMEVNCFESNRSRALRFEQCEA
jgi:transposase InsO family protein